MKLKSLGLLVFTCMLVLGFEWRVTKLANAESRLPYTTVSLDVEGKCDSCGLGLNIDGTTYVPIRMIVETLGGEVDWNKSEQKVTIRSFESVRNIPDTENQAESPRDDYLVETEGILTEINKSVDDLKTIEQHLQLAKEYYEVSNETLFVDEVKTMMKVEEEKHKALNEKFITYQEQYIKEHTEIIELSETIKELKNVIDNYNFSIYSLEQYISNGRVDDLKNYVLYRKFALNGIDKIIENIKG